MYKHQSMLPMLPVPQLEQTFDKYLKTIRPLTSTEEFANSQRLVQQFLDSPQSRQLQQRLIERRELKAKEGRSWFIDWWNDWAYLGYARSRYIMNHN
jgi:carnitine O-acetyltransferase